MEQPQRVAQLVGQCYDVVGVEGVACVEGDAGQYVEGGVGVVVGGVQSFERPGFRQKGEEGHSGQPVMVRRVGIGEDPDVDIAARIPQQRGELFGGRLRDQRFGIERQVAAPHAVDARFGERASGGVGGGAYQTQVRVGALPRFGLKTVAQPQVRVAECRFDDLPDEVLREWRVVGVQQVEHRRQFGHVVVRGDGRDRMGDRFAVIDPFRRAQVGAVPGGCAGNLEHA